ncbi:hypothetical protein DFH08DRAFT_978037 [Mycena albidolilacea]|uniref:CxC2-like cysteine cluster KDZ transposase-associated domain-containing protein n=1 Tax=Mycena albidolilacea TaxID=1033008 RepID=A0AAD6YZK0_9AGAR|nr:hypothetical protein DFH08DRAFT_978037 [Mycena albidolilacea]
MATTLVSDSDSDHEDALPRSREEGLFHRGIRTDAQGRTHAAMTRVAVPASPVKRPPQRDMLEFDVSPMPNWDIGNGGGADSPFPFSGEESFAFDEGHPLDPGRRKERDSDHPMAQWVTGCRERFLDEMLRLEGRGISDTRRNAEIACLVALHMDNPLHRVEIWNDNAFFEVINLKSLGLRIQLGHGRNGTCPGTLVKRAKARAAPAQADVPEVTAATARGDEEREEAAAKSEKGLRDDFCIVDSSGVHEVGLDFCSCSLAEPHDIQLLRARLYPATTTNPATAATFRVLRDFHLLSLEAKCSAHHFYNKLARQTNNSGVFQPRTRYNEFRRMTRQWRHLQMLKRAGRGHATEGIAGTKAGECALLCPACPQPGKNLPRDGSWRYVPRERRFLYALFLALDANFRMKRKDVSSEAEDPSLGDGIAFFSQVEAYMAHLEKHWDLEQEKSTCVAHDAVDERQGGPWDGSIRDRHSGLYINMDYMLWKSLESYDDLVELFISYDIVCQWHKNIWTRLASYNPELRMRGACNILFSFNLTPHVGQTDGEAPERGWGERQPSRDQHKGDGTWRTARRS